MRILLDVDGVCADFTAEILHRVGSNLTLEDITQWDLFELMGADKKKRAMNVLKEQYFWRYLPVIDGAQAGYAALVAAGHEVCFATSPWVSCREWGHARREWLKEHFIISNEQLIIVNDKSWLSGDVMIDDKPENLTAWQSLNTGLAMLYDAPYNANCGRPLARHDWTSIVNELCNSKEVRG